MNIHHHDETTKVIHGDCIETMNQMEPESVDAIVTDPPYGLGFMGKKWDGLPPSLEWAEACYRVLKPGGHIAAFGGTVLDPFAGSGTTIEAARKLGFKSIGIEAEEAYLLLIDQRLQRSNTGPTED